MSGGLLRLALEVLGLLVAVGAVAAARLRRFRISAGDVLPTAASTLAAAALVLTLAGLPNAVSKLNDSRKQGVGPRAGLEHCFEEVHAASRLRFVHWLRSRLPARATYTLDYAGQLDPLCISLVLLPALPGEPGERTNWTVAFGTVTPAIRARIARGDPTVHVFADGFALAEGSAQ